MGKKPAKNSLTFSKLETFIQETQTLTALLTTENFRNKDVSNIIDNIRKALNNCATLSSLLSNGNSKYDRIGDSVLQVLDKIKVFCNAITIGSKSLTTLIESKAETDRLEVTLYFVGTNNTEYSKYKQSITSITQYLDSTTELNEIMTSREMNNKTRTAWEVLAQKRNDTSKALGMLSKTLIPASNAPIISSLTEFDKQMQLVKTELKSYVSPDSSTGMPVLSKIQKGVKRQVKEYLKLVSRQIALCLDPHANKVEMETKRFKQQLASCGFTETVLSEFIQAETTKKQNSSNYTIPTESYIIKLLSPDYPYIQKHDLIHNLLIPNNSSLAEFIAMDVSSLEELNSKIQAKPELRTVFSPLLLQDSQEFEELKTFISNAHELKYLMEEAMEELLSFKQSNLALYFNLMLSTWVIMGLNMCTISPSFPVNPFDKETDPVNMNVIAAMQAIAGFFQQLMVLIVSVASLTFIADFIQTFGRNKRVFIPKGLKSAYKRNKTILLVFLFSGLILYVLIAGSISITYAATIVAGKYSDFVKTTLGFQGAGAIIFSLSLTFGLIFKSSLVLPTVYQVGKR